MGIIQRIKDVFSGVFPLHLNATVRDLEERLEAMEFMEGVQRIAVESLKEINHEFFVANQGLQKELDDAYEDKLAGFLRHQQTIKASSCLSTTQLMAHRIIVSLPALRLVFDFDRKHLESTSYFDRFIDDVAKRLSDQAKVAVYERVVDQLRSTQFHHNTFKEKS